MKGLDVELIRRKSFVDELQKIAGRYGIYSGNPPIDLNNTLSKFHNKHDLQPAFHKQLSNTTDLTPTDMETGFGVDNNASNLSDMEDNRILRSHLRGR